MNKARRKRYMEIAEKLRDLYAELDEIACEEREAYDNLPEGLQYSEKGEHLDSVASELEDIVSEIESLADRLECCEEV